MAEDQLFTRLQDSYCSPWLFSTSIEASSSKLIGHRLTYLVSQRPNTCKTGVRLNHKSDVPIGCIEKEIKKAWGDTSHLVTDYERRKLLRVLIRVVKCHRETSKNSHFSLSILGVYKKKKRAWIAHAFPENCISFQLTDD